LIELLFGANDVVRRSGFKFNANIIADYLLANGVIVPPCKVGDMVYRIAEDGKTITEERVGAIHLEFTIDNGTGWQDVWWLKDYNIGNTAFLSREEAEQALEGGAE
jgi:hypothetical protein